PAQGLGTPFRNRSNAADPERRAAIDVAPSRPAPVSPVKPSIVNEREELERRATEIRRAVSMVPTRIAHVLVAAGLFALAALISVPLGFEARGLLAAYDDPAAIADR